MQNQNRQLDRYRCVICGRKVGNAHQAFIREDRPYGARLCREHAQIVAEHFADATITTLKLAIIRGKMREAGYQVDVAEYKRIGEGYSLEQSQKILSKVLD
ncbi:hypothetical protein KKD19_01605 [Patescibacteria group bacterium]|nr:hypothetical protein [Patescibacteria group bacterium]MBU4511926.1 hypothetical protein [Patescibacteria group bacterium]MCG2692894.1 hypothetical protein [Candidatus Parcubacteria bacterium]